MAVRTSGETHVGASARYLGAALTLGLATAVAAAFGALGLDDTNLVLAYLPSVAASGAWFGYGPAVFAACGAVVLFNFFFTAPRYTLRVDDPSYVVTFVVMLGIGLAVAGLTARLRQRTSEARERERRAEATYRLSRALSAATSVAGVIATAERELTRALGGEVRVRLAPGEARAAKRGPSLTLPLTASRDVLGALELPAAATPAGAQGQLLETYAALVALALEREHSGARARDALVEAEGERLRASISSAMSHDLRTPLAIITGASSSLIEAGEAITPADRDELLQTIWDESERLTRIVEDLLHLTRLASGRPELRKEWHVVEDLVGSALHRASRALGERAVDLDVPDGLPLVSVDGVLVELALINLLDNAAKYSPRGTPLLVEAGADERTVSVSVSDRGPGVPDHEKARVFEPFFRGAGHDARGTGLGLSICRAIGALHGGSVTVTDRVGGGATFRLALPREAQPPDVAGDPFGGLGPAEEVPDAD